MVYGMNRVCHPPSDSPVDDNGKAMPIIEDHILGQVRGSVRIVCIEMGPIIQNAMIVFAHFTGLRHFCLYQLLKPLF